MARRVLRRRRNILNFRSIKQWWNKYYTHVYSLLGIILAAIGLKAVFSNNEPTVYDYVKSKDLIDIKKGEVKDYLVNNVHLDRFSFFLKDQNGGKVNYWLDQYDFKLITVTSVESPCKSTLETISTVKRELAPYLSIQAYGIFGDSIQPAVLKEFILNNGLSIVGLSGNWQSVRNAADGALLMIDHEIGVNGKDEVVHSNSIAIIHAKFIYFINDATHLTAKRLEFSLLNTFKDEFEQARNGKANIDKNALDDIVARSDVADKRRIFPMDCGFKMGQLAVYK